MPQHRQLIKPKQRWLFPYYGGYVAAATNQTFTAGRVYLVEFEVIAPVTVDQITWVNGTTAAGNVTVGIYGPLVTEETCAGAAVAVQSASTAQSGTSTPQSVSLTATTLQPGRYYIAIEGSDGTGTLMRQSAQQAQVTGWTQFYDRAGGYGALTDPCPAVTNSASVAPAIRVRCVV